MQWNLYIIMDTISSILCGLSKEVSLYSLLWRQFYQCTARNKEQKLVGHFFENRISYRLATDCCPIENVHKSWLTKIDFGWPNAQIDRKMADCYF